MFPADGVTKYGVIRLTLVPCWFVYIVLMSVLHWKISPPGCGLRSGSTSYNLPNKVTRHWVPDGVAIFGVAGTWTAESDFVTGLVLVVPV